MTSRKTYLERLGLVIAQIHKCSCDHVCSTAVKETLRGKVLWEGAVETFKLIGHPKAQRCYAWTQSDGKSFDVGKVVSVLKIPPVKCPHDAVKHVLGNVVTAAKARLEERLP